MPAPQVYLSKKNQAGFTLIESLVVLSIFFIISSVTAFSLKPQYFMVEDEVFISQLKADLFYAQQYAISHQCDVFVLVMEDQHKYSIYVHYDLPPIVERQYSTNIAVYGGSLPLFFNFQPDGNVNKFGSFYIRTRNKSYRMVILIGMGRFYVVEE